MRPSRLDLVSPDLAAELATVGYESLTPDNAARLRRLAREGAFGSRGRPSFVVYRLASGGHRQTGVVVEVPIDDYRQRRVRAHEATDAERVRRLGEVLEATRLELVPLTLAHEPCPPLRSALAAASAAEPDLAVTTDRVDQAVWLVRDDALARDIEQALALAPTLYIADGHHRIAAAEQYAARHARPGGSDPAGYVLGALFPWDEVRILGYHRAVRRPDRPAVDLVATLERQAATARITELGATESPAPGPRRIAMHLGGSWYHLDLRPPIASDSPRAGLDIAIFESAVLGPAWEIPDPASDPRVVPVPGTVDAAAMARRCAERNEVGFLLHPPSMVHVCAVSDAGEVMPRKATWFDPKARTGPFLRDLAAPA